MVSRSQGFSLIESLLASSLFGLMVTAIVGSLIYGHESVRVSGERARALYLAEEGLEAARNIRDNNFSNLVNGTHGLLVASNQWTLSGNSDVTNGFTRAVTISTVDANTKTVASTVSWQQTLQRAGTVTLTTRLTNWQANTATQADQIVITVSGATIGGSGNAYLRGIEITNNGSVAAVINRMTVSWTKPNQNIKEIKMEDVVVWSNNGPGTPTGTQSSGTELNIQNATIPAGEDDFKIDHIRMTGNASGDTFTIIFKFTDGSTKQVTLSPPS